MGKKQLLAMLNKVQRKVYDHYVLISKELQRVHAERSEAWKYLCEVKESYSKMCATLREIDNNNSDLRQLSDCDVISKKRAEADELQNLVTKTDKELQVCLDNKTISMLEMRRECQSLSARKRFLSQQWFGVLDDIAAEKERVQQQCVANEATFSYAELGRLFEEKMMAPVKHQSLDKQWQDLKAEQTKARKALENSINNPSLFKQLIRTIEASKYT